MKRRYILIVLSIIVFSIVLFGCGKSNERKVDKVNTTNDAQKNEENKNDEIKVKKEKKSFKTDDVDIEFEYSTDFEITDKNEAISKLEEYDIEDSNNMIKAILISEKKEAVIVSEENKKENLEELKKYYEQISNYGELQVKIEKNEIVSENVLCTIMIVQDRKMQIITTVSGDKTITIQYISNEDDYDLENANIILESVKK